MSNSVKSALPTRKIKLREKRLWQWSFRIYTLKLIYFIIDGYHSDDLKTLRALASTCKILSCYCRKHIYHTVIVGSGTDEVANKYVNLSLPERFATLVVQGPYILDHIQKFYIMIQNCRRREKYDPLNREEESIVFLLTCRMKKLRQFKIRVGLDWILVPDHLQNAISITFPNCQLWIMLSSRESKVLLWISYISRVWSTSISVVTLLPRAIKSLPFLGTQYIATV